MLQRNNRLLQLGTWSTYKTRMMLSCLCR